MARYANGQPVRLSTTVKDLTSTLVDPSTLSLAVLKPDASTQTYASPTHDSTGTYHQDIPATDLTQNGHYQYVWTSTGTGAGVSRGDFDVFDPFEPAILPLADAKDALNIGQTTTTYDSEIQSYLDTVTGALEAITGGPAFNRTITNERVCPTSYTSPRLALRYRIVQSVTSITDESTGTALDLTSLLIDQTTNMLSMKNGIPFLYGGPCLVTYVAGQGTIVPPAFNVAARIILQHLWKTQRGPGVVAAPNMDGTYLPGYSYAIPPEALEVLRPYSSEAYV